MAVVDAGFRSQILEAQKSLMAKCVTHLEEMNDKKDTGKIFLVENDHDCDM